MNKPIQTGEEFYFLIEQKLQQQGYETLDTLPKKRQGKIFIIYYYLKGKLGSLYQMRVDQTEVEDGLFCLKSQGYMILAIQAMN
jgi:hypothetical protein